MRCFLRRSVFVRVLRGQAFLLDVHRDEYLCFANSPILVASVVGWPADTAGATDQQGGDESIIESMLTERLLTTDAHSGRSAAPPDLSCVGDDWSDHWRATTTEMMSPYVGQFLLAFLETTLSWRLLPLECRLARLQRHTNKHAAVEQDSASVERLTGIFLRLRAWTYTAHDRCMFDSMVLANFLHRCGHSARFVVGVSGQPFAAHSWVQLGEYALNELDSRARRYAPILVV